MAGRLPEGRLRRLTTEVTGRAATTPAGTQLCAGASG
jgi:hypothetical protein